MLSGVHAGDVKSVRCSRVSCFGLEPSDALVHRLSAPSRSLMNTIRFPSGEYLGCESHAMPDVIGRASPPAIGTW